jgi:hypothetical protein
MGRTREPSEAFLSYVTRYNTDAQRDEKFISSKTYERQHI